MEKYFSLPYVGDLFLEHAFYTLEDEPILFVCKGIGDFKFLCSCCRLYEKWVVGQVSEMELINLIDDKVSIRETFSNCDTKFVVRWDGEKFEVNGDVPDELLPKAGALLELDREKCGAYRDGLTKSWKQQSVIRSLAKENSQLLSVWKQCVSSHEQYKKICFQWKQHQEIYTKFLKEWTALEPVINEVVSAISVQLTHIHWDELSQYINSLPVAAEAEKEEEVKQEIIVVKQKGVVSVETHNHVPYSDNIQYLAA